MRLRWLTTAILLACSACAPGSSRRATAVDASTGAIVRSAGAYPLSPNGLVLNVRVNNGLVEFDMEQNGVQLLTGTPLRASDYSRWFLSWDAKHSHLWFYSGDVGSSRWRKAKNKGYVREDLHELTQEQLVTMPLAFYDAMSSGAKKRYPSRAAVAAEKE